MEQPPPQTQPKEKPHRPDNTLGGDRDAQVREHLWGLPASPVVGLAVERGALCFTRRYLRISTKFGSGFELNDLAELGPGSAPAFGQP